MGRDNNAPHDKARSQGVRPRGCMAAVTCALLLALPCAGLMGGLIVMREQREGGFVGWQPLGGPPGGGVDIVTGNHSAVDIQTSVGTVFRRTHKGRGESSQWAPASSPLDMDKVAFGQQLVQGTPPPPPGKVVKVLQLVLYQADSAFETRYALMDDGTVWIWEYDVGGMTSWAQLLVPTLGAVAGVAAAGAASAVLWVLTRRRAA